MYSAKIEEELNLFLLPGPLYRWIINNVQKPIAGFEHKKNPDGSFYTKRQQLIATHKQLLLLAKQYIVSGHKETETIKVLNYFVK